MKVTVLLTAAAAAIAATAIAGTFALTMTACSSATSEKVGSMNQDYVNPDTSTSSISVLADEGDKLQINYSCKTIDGNVEFSVYDSGGKLVKTLDSAKKLKTFIDIAKDDTYIIKAERKDFLGEYKLNVYIITE